MFNRCFICFFGFLLVTACDAKKNKVGIAQESSPSTLANTSTPYWGPLPDDWKPAPFLELKEPVILATVDGKDISKMPAFSLVELAKEAGQIQDFEKAKIYSYWATKTLPEELYDLARYCALSGDNEEAFYWLQQAGMVTSVDVRWAERDADLGSLRSDARWPEFVKWLEWTARYHRRNAKPVTTLILPTAYDPQKDPPLNVVVWLHGNRSRPHEFVDPRDPESFAQELANTLKIAFIGVSGTRIESKDKFTWAENAIKDLQRVNAAIDEVKDKVRIKTDGVILFGHSEGAQVGLQLAARNPDLFAGAIIVSPSQTRQNVDLIDSTNPLLKQRGFVCGCYEIEAEGGESLPKNIIKWTKKTGAKSLLETYPDQESLTLPPDFDERFPKWIKFILEANNAK